jgi:hypothetical protein
MKRVKNLIKLSNLKVERLNDKELGHVIGALCHCGCFYAACGGSSSSSNYSANNKKGFVSPLPDLDDPNWGIVT